MMGVDHLSTFNSEKLSVNFMCGTTSTQPLIPRRYTLTHSDFTGELYLDIGSVYAWEKINPTRDEVLGEWCLFENCLFFVIHVYLDQGEYSFDEASKRNQVFRRELPLALASIRYGDRILLKTHRYLDNKPIIIHFNSRYKAFSKQEDWGTFSQYIAPLTKDFPTSFKTKS